MFGITHLSLHDFFGVSVLGKNTFTTSVTVFEVEQNRSGELTHPIRRTRSMHSKGSGSEGMGGTTQENVPIYLGLRWQQWKAFDISHLLTSTVPSFGVCLLCLLH